MALAAAALGLDAPTLRARLPGSGAPLLRPASVTIDGGTWRIEDSELESLDAALSHGRWKIAELYAPMKVRTGSLHRRALTAQLLGSSVEAVRGALEWHDQSMRDADPESTVF